MKYIYIAVLGLLMGWTLGNWHQYADAMHPRVEQSYLSPYTQLPKPYNPQPQNKGKFNIYGDTETLQPTTLNFEHENTRNPQRAFNYTRLQGGIR